MSDMMNGDSISRDLEEAEKECKWHKRMLTILIFKHLDTLIVVGNSYDNVVIASTGIHGAAHQLRGALYVLTFIGPALQKAEVWCFINQQSSGCKVRLATVTANHKYGK